MRLSEAFELYRTDVIAFRNMSHKTEENNIYAEKSFISVLGDIDVCDLTFLDVRNWSNKYKRAEINTKRGYIIQLRQVLKFLKHRGIECMNFEQINVPKREKKEMRLLSDEEVQRIIESCDNRHYSERKLRLRNKLIVAILAGSGLRVSELISLDRNSIRNRQFSVFGKGSKTRPAFITREADDYLQKYLKSRDDTHPALFITRNGRRMTAGEVRRAVRLAGLWAGVENLHPHDFRHYFGSKKAENGMHIFHLQRLMGHSSMATTQIYLHVRDKHLFEVFDQHS